MSSRHLECQIPLPEFWHVAGQVWGFGASKLPCIACANVVTISQNSSCFVAPGPLGEAGLATAKRSNEELSAILRRRALRESASMQHEVVCG